MTKGIDDLVFSYIPSFAQYIYDHHLSDYIKQEVSFSRKMNIPIWEQFRALSDEEIISGSSAYYARFLLSVAKNRSAENLAEGIRNFRQDLLDHISRDHLTPEDIILTHAARKQAMMHFISQYTCDAALIVKLVEEMNTIFTRFDIESTNTYFELLNEKMDEEKSIKDKLFSTSPGFYYIYDIANDVQVLPSERLFKTLGYNRYDYAGNNHFFKEIMHPEDLENSIHYVASLSNMAEGEVRFFEYRLRNAHGEYQWMRNYESVYKWTDSRQPAMLLGVAFDISKERFYTEEIRLREEELLEAQRIAKVGAFTWDIQNNAVTSFSANLESLGLCEGDSFLEIMANVHPTDRKRVTELYQKAVAGKREYDIEYRCNIMDRERYLWSRGRVVLEDNEPRYLRATVMDVTEHHQMVHKLQRSEELYKQAQALNRIGNWSWEINSNQVQWSDELYKIYDLSPKSEQITLERYLSFIHPDDIDSRSHMLSEQIGNPGHREYYFRVTTNNGTEKILYGQSEVLIDEYGKPYKMIGTCQDVTEQKTLEKTLYDRTIQLQKSNASLKVFAYISSHDLKEPLRKISLFGDRLRLLNKTKLDEQSNGLLNTIIQSSLRLQQMIDEILSVSKINADEHFEHCSLNEILEEVVSGLEIQVREHNAVINYDHLPDAFVNPIQMRQLFTNLISNSLKFSRAGEPCIISVTCDTPPAEDLKEAGLDSLSRHVRIRVEDNGIGFQEEYAEKIFAIFQRLHDKSAYKGSGIGLAICREIVAHHGGIIRASGVLHEGAAFTIILPVNIHTN
jgi:PAS domain S-box-containing protein